MCQFLLLSLLCLLGGCDHHHKMQEPPAGMLPCPSVKSPSRSEQSHTPVSIEGAQQAIKRMDISDFLRIVRQLPEDDQRQVQATLRGDWVAAHWQGLQITAISEDGLYDEKTLRRLPKPKDTSLFDVWAAAYTVVNG